MNADFPFERETEIEIGTAAANTIAKLNGYPIFLAQEPDGNITVFRIALASSFVCGLPAAAAAAGAAFGAAFGGSAASAVADPNAASRRSLFM